MHGMIFLSLKNYLAHYPEVPAWPDLLTEANISSSKIHLAISNYPDEEAVALVVGAAGHRGQSLPQFLEAFGDYVSGDLMKSYAMLVSPHWGPLEMIEKAETVVHTHIRKRHPGVHPPILRTERTRPDQVLIRYDSPRKMCFLAVGVAHGVARHYGVEFKVEQTACMHKGDPECHIEITLLPKEGQPVD